MPSQHLLISNPPHDEVDAMSAASHFGLTAAEVRMKANYRVPEIWFAQEDRDGLERTAVALREAGFEIVVVEGSDLVGIPLQSPATSVTFEDDGLLVDEDGSGWKVAYDAPAICVFACPQPVEEHMQRGGASVMARVTSRGRSHRRTPQFGADGTRPEFSAFVDLYLPSDEGVRRICIDETVTTVSGLSKDPAGSSGIWSAVNACETRFEHMHVDRRLVDMRLRLIQLVAPPGSSHRSGLSYATTALSELLGSLSPALGNAPQAALSSQLAYLTSLSRTA